MNLKDSLLLLVVWTICCLSAGPVSGQAKHGKANNVCINPPSGGSVQKPVLPNKYVVRIECNIMNKNFSTDVHEFYDYKGNRGAVHQFESGLEMWGIYDYTVNELLVVTPSDNNNCQVTNLATSDNKFVFGDTATSKASKGGHIYSVSGALRFGGNFSETYVGPSTVRGIPCNHWWSCQYWKGMDATMNVDWHFSAPGWNTSIGPASVPVRLEVQGVVYDTPNGPPRPFHHMYEFADFRESINYPSEFEIPRQTYCPGRINKKSLPVIPPYFSYQLEEATQELKSLGWQKEYYDFDNKLFRFDSIPIGGRRVVTEVDDFSTGISYVMDRMLGNCTTSSIQMKNFDVKIVDPRHVRMMNPNEFFGLAGANFAYEGVRQIRDVDADVWIGQRQDWPPGQKINSTWEWYFATNKWADYTGQKVFFSQPLMVEINAPALGLHFVFNVFNFDRDVLDFWDFNVLSCYKVTKRRDMSFKISYRAENYLMTHQMEFRRGLIKSLSQAAGISPMRITNLKVQYLAKEVGVSFSMLAAPTVAGDTVNTTHGPSLATAATNLQYLINGEGLYITVNHSGSILNYQAGAFAFANSGTVVDARPIVQNRIQAPPSTSSKYTSGALVAIGLCMMFGCFIIACVSMYFVYKKSGGSWDSFIPKSFDSSGKDGKK